MRESEGNYAFPEASLRRSDRGKHTEKQSGRIVERASQPNVLTLTQRRGGHRESVRVLRHVEERDLAARSCGSPEMGGGERRVLAVEAGLAHGGAIEGAELVGVPPLLQATANGRPRNNVAPGVDPSLEVQPGGKAQVLVRGPREAVDAPLLTLSRDG